MPNPFNFSGVGKFTVTKLTADAITEGLLWKI